MKPLYRIPTMREIAALPKNGFKVASTFSGCGGSSLGYKMAGFEVLYASEFVPAAQETYRANHPGTYLDTRDIRTVSADEVLDRIGMQAGELDLFDGSPPCASFSTAGKREAGWGQVKKYSDTRQRTDDLFFEFVQLIQGIRPKVFVAENVSGLVRGTAKGYFLQILAALKGAGYRVKCRLLDAQWLGVPQMRQRTIFIGVREDLGIDPVHPRALPYRYHIRDAIPGVVSARYDSTGNWPDREYNVDHEPIGCIMASAAYHMKVVVDSIHGVGECRRFTIPEIKRLCSFPDDFILTGSYPQQWERLGRAVPPVMMSHVAATIRDEILSRAA